MKEFRELPDMDEYRMYIRDRVEWAKYCAEKWRRRMDGKPEAEKRATWNRLPKCVRDELLAKRSAA